MLISFLISAQSKDDMLFKTMLSLKKQTNGDFEILIFNDEALATSDREHNQFLNDLFVENPKVTLVDNSKFQGHSFNWNLGINIAQGDYIAILKEGDVLEPNFVAAIADIVQANEAKIDIIQFKKNLTGLMTTDRAQYLQEDHLYRLPDDKEVFAYVQDSVYAKVFRTKFLNDFRLRFRPSVRYDALFLYKALGHARTFYNASAVLLTHKISVLRYSAFDLANQWPHVLNYYRRIGIYKDLKNELNYAYFYNLIFNFLLLVKDFDNPQLYKKAIRFVETKLTNRLEEFNGENTIFLENKDPEFSKILLNFSPFIRNELKSVR